jgi:hypothetical protein
VGEILGDIWCCVSAWRHGRNCSLQHPVDASAPQSHCPELGSTRDGSRAAQTGPASERDGRMRSVAFDSPGHVRNWEIAIRSTCFQRRSLRLAHLQTRRVPVSQSFTRRHCNAAIMQALAPRSTLLRHCAQAVSLDHKQPIMLPGTRFITSLDTSGIVTTLPRYNSRYKAMLHKLSLRDYLSGMVSSPIALPRWARSASPLNRIHLLPPCLLSFLWP